MRLEDKYFEYRSELVSDPQEIINQEERFTDILINDVIREALEDIYRDFYIGPQKLLPFWMNYEPSQRGRQPTGNSVPWLELGEKTSTSNILLQLSKTFDDIKFTGVPSGADVRFITKNYFVHLDIKMTGPNDNPNEVVVPPYQVSGDGKKWDEGIINSTHPIKYQRGKRKGNVNYLFQPKLPPFYIIDGKPLLCLTYFIDVIYDIFDYGIHPLEHIEASCVPNGLIMFDTLNLADTEGLLIAGKDDSSVADSDKRIRIRLNPLSQIAEWRSGIFYQEDEKWKKKSRKAFNSSKSNFEFD